MSLRVVFISACIFFSAALFAQPKAIHTNGDAHSRLLAQMLFPDAPVLPSPGADGLLVWQKLEGNKTDVAIQVAFAVHYLPLVRGSDDYAKTHELLATVAHARQALVARKGSGILTLKDIKNLNRPVTVGWAGNACEALVKDLLQEHGINWTYVPHKTPNDAIGFFMGGHIDLICPAAASLRQLEAGGEINVLVDLTRHHGFALTTHVFVSKDMPQANKQKLLQHLTRNITTEETHLAETNGFLINVKTGHEAAFIFNRDRLVWARILKNAKP
jgi:tripartite-type tricarboxylate transporter receptor subunit TctC